MHKIAARIKRINEHIGRLIAWLCLPMVVGTFGIALFRYAFSMSWIWLQELIIWLHALLFMLASAYTLVHDEHVRVDIFYRDFSERGKAWANLLGSIIFLLPVSLLIIYVSFDYVTTSWQINEGSREAGGLPFPFVPILKTAIPLSFLLVLIQGVAIILSSLAVLFGQNSESSAATENNHETPEGYL